MTNPVSASSDEALRQLYERYRLVSRATNDAVWDLDLQTGALSWGEGFFELFGYRPGEVEPGVDSWTRRLHPEDHDRVKQGVNRVIAGGDERWTDEYRFRRADGSYADIFDRGFVLRNATGQGVRMIGAMQDISERTHALQALRQGEERLRLIVEHCPAAIAMFDRDMRYLVASRRWHEDYRLGNQSLIGRSHYDVFPEIPQRWKDIHRRCLAGAAERSEDDSFVREDGTTDWVRWEVRPWHNTHGDIGGLIMFTEVVTDRRRAELAVREREEHFRALFEHAADGIFILSHDLVCRDVNACCARMLGYAREQLIGMNVTLFAAEPDRPKVAPELSNLLAGRPYRREWEIQRSDSTSFPVEISAAQVSGGLVIVTMRDMTARREAEEMLRRRADELETFHRLSIGRELQMIELKREINRLATELGRAAPYDLRFTEQG